MHCRAGARQNHIKNRKTETERVFDLYSHILPHSSCNGEFCLNCALPDSCTGMKCQPNQVCKVVKNMATCQCPEISDCGYNPALVCGSDRNEYPNECLLKVKSCLAASGLVLRNKGKCGKHIVTFSSFFIQLTLVSHICEKGFRRSFFDKYCLSEGAVSISKLSLSLPESIMEKCSVVFTFESEEKYY